MSFLWEIQGTKGGLKVRVWQILRRYFFYQHLLL